MNLLRVYLDPDEIGADGYPHAWHRPATQRLIEEGAPLVGPEKVNLALQALGPFRMAIKDYVREQAGHRCARCGHPYTKGNPANSPRSEWSPCDGLCTHGGPARMVRNGRPISERGFDAAWINHAALKEHDPGATLQAQWRILTVHHLNGIKHDCRWWNLTALCQRCHLSVQSRVKMERVYPWEHSEWFKPYAAGWYAWAYLGEELSRDETMARLDDLLALELDQRSHNLGTWRPE